MRYLLLGLFSLISTAVFAQAAACRPEVERFCDGKENAMECLLDRQQELSDACYDALKQGMEKRRGFAACKEDAGRYCRGIQPGGGRIVQCLSEHQNEISNDCYDQLARKKSGASAR